MASESGFRNWSELAHSHFSDGAMCFVESPLISRSNVWAAAQWRPKLCFVDLACCSGVAAALDFALALGFADGAGTDPGLGVPGAEPGAEPGVGGATSVRALLLGGAPFSATAAAAAGSTPCSSTAA
eukprot:3259181-Pyramimonas_sp.AAC.1